MVKNPPEMQEKSSVPGLGRSAGEGNDNPLQYSGLENPMDKGAWQMVGYSPWGCKELDSADPVNNSDIREVKHIKKKNSKNLIKEKGKEIIVTQLCLTLRPHGL